jgi:hypothetical protein
MSTVNFFTSRNRAVTIEDRCSGDEVAMDQAAACAAAKPSTGLHERARGDLPSTSGGICAEPMARMV